MRREMIERLIRMHLPAVDSTYRGDANETMLFTRQLEHLFTRVYEAEFPDYIGRTIVPVNTEVDPGSETFTYRMMQDVGEARVMDSYADDIPLVDGFGTEHTGKVRSIADGFFVSIQDLRAAIKAGVNIESRKALTARRVMESKLDQILATGSSAHGLGGFANNANVPLVVATTGTWDNAARTAAEIQGDVEKLCASIFDTTKGMHGSADNGSQLTLALNSVAYRVISTKRIDTFNTMTVLEYLLSKFPMVKEIRSWHRLDTAGASGNNRRIVAYHKMPDVVEAIIPQEFEVFPFQPKGLGFMVPCHMRTGGVIWRYPKAAAYMDNI